MPKIQKETKSNNVIKFSFTETLSRMFKFSRVVIYRACDHEEVDRNDGIYSFFSIAIIVHCQSACSVFSNLPKHRSAVSLNLCSARRANSCGERFSFLEDNEKFVFQLVGYLGNVSTFLIGATNPFSELIHPLLKLPNCVLKFYNLSEALLFRLTPSSRTRHRFCWRTATSTHF